MDWIKKNRVLSMMGQRRSFGMALQELAAENDRIFAMSGDLLKSSSLDRFAKEYPDRCLNAGIAEQNAIGVAAGLADSGKIPFMATFAKFAAMRSNEFVRHFMSYMHCNIKLVGLDGGVATGIFGDTHYSLEDIAVLRSMPDIMILSPADCLEVVKCVEYSADHEGPVYIRLSGIMNHPIVNKQDYTFVPGKAIELKEGKDAVIFATGSMVNTALKAAGLLADESIDVSVINMHTLKPIDEDMIKKFAGFPLVLTIEEHSATGGLGSAVSEVLSSCGFSGRLKRMGTMDKHIPAGTYEYMLEQHGLTPENVVKEIKNNMI